MAIWGSLVKTGIASAVALAIGAASVASAWSSLGAAAAKARESTRLAALSAVYLAPQSAAAGADMRNGPAPVAILTHRPLDSAALARAGFEASIAGRTRLAAALMAEALHRDPRSRPVRLWMLTEALKRKDIPTSIAQLDRLMALDPQSEAYLPTLAEVARQPGAERPLAALIATNPPWRAPFLLYLTTSKSDSRATDGLVFRLNNAGTPAGAAADLQGRVIAKLLAKGDYDGAYLAWINFLPESAMAQVAPVYDGGFAGLSGPQPFNWSFNDSELASVGIEKGEGLQIDYPAAQSVRMASQLLVLKPGTYRLDYSVRGSGESDDGGAISWRLTCAKGDAVVFDLPIKNLTDRPAARAARFVVPAGCPAQLLSVEGVAGAFPKTRSVSIRRVAISVLR